MKFSLKKIRAFGLGILALAVVSCTEEVQELAKVKELTGINENAAEVLASIKWKTTKVIDASGKDVTSEKGMYVGFASYDRNGDFEITDLKNTPRIKGNWGVSIDLSKRFLVFNNAEMKTLFRAVEIVVLTPDLFTYKVTEADGKVYSVEHEVDFRNGRPVLYSGKNPTQLLEEVDWVTTTVKEGEKDVTSENMGFVGNAYYEKDGTFRITTKEGVARINGHWFLSLDGKKRFLIFETGAEGNKTLVNRSVEITQLTPEHFTYKITVTREGTTHDLSVEHVPIKK